MTRLSVADWLTRVWAIHSRSSGIPALRAAWPTACCTKAILACVSGCTIVTKRSPLREIPEAIRPGSFNTIRGFALFRYFCIIIFVIFTTIVLE
jgi:hypothetical protein